MPGWGASGTAGFVLQLKALDMLGCGYIASMCTKWCDYAVFCSLVKHIASSCRVHPQPPAPASSPPAEAPVQTPAQVPASVVADPASSPALEGPPQTPSQTMPSQAPASAVADPASSPSLEGPPQTPAQAPAQTPSQAPASVVGPAAERAPEASPEMQHTASMLGQALFVQPHGGKEVRRGGRGWHS